MSNRPPTISNSFKSRQIEITEQLTLASQAKVGIGTSVPNERLTVIGNISSTGAVYAGGPILSGGVDLLDIFTLALPPSGIQTLSFDDNGYNLSISQGNTVSLSAISTAIVAVSSQIGATIVGLTGSLPNTISTYLANNDITVNTLTVVGGVTAQSANIPVTVIDVTTSKTFNNSDSNKVFHFNTTSGSLCAIVPDSLSSGFNIAILNTGTNSLVISAANLKSTGTTIVDEFGGAYIYKQNSDIFAVGRLF